MAHQFGDPLETVVDPRASIQDVCDLIEGKQDNHRVTNQFFHEGVLILEVVSKEKQHRRKGIIEVMRRILILGKVAGPIGEMVAFQILDNNTSWTSHGMRLTEKKTSYYPDVLWCKGLAMVHTGTGFAREATNKHRVKQVTELMGYACDRDVAWQDLDLRAMKVCRYLYHGWSVPLLTKHAGKN